MSYVTKVILTLILFLPLFAESKSPDEIRAAFIYQLAKFVDFADQEEKMNTRFCFYHLDRGPGLFLKQQMQLKIRNKPIVVTKIDQNSSIMELSERCDITYIDETMEDDILPSWTDTIALNMVTVGESIEFLERGGIISLVQEGSKIRLYINRPALTIQSFFVRSRLLAVSKFHPN